MKILTNKVLISNGDFVTDSEFQASYNEIKSAILSVTWASQHEFIINPVKKGNGVNPIKNNFVGHLVYNDWEAEARLEIVKGLRPGPIDAIKKTAIGTIAVEWETGNISSSHRALNKMAVGILQNQLIAGFLVLPHKNLAQYLTDRIGNFEELSPYFSLYSSLKIRRGHIEVFGVDYDAISKDVVLIPKGKDGNSKKTK